MAHRGHLRSRIEHLLNERSFRQAFSGGRARIAAAILLVPIALFAATAMVRVHAAGQQTPPAQTPDSVSPVTAPAQAVPAAPVQAPPPSTPPDATAPPVNTPPPALVPDEDQVIAAPRGTVILAPRAPGSPDIVVPEPPAPGGWGQGISGAWSSADAKAWADMAKARTLVQAEMAKDMAAFNKQNFFRDGLFNDGNSYAYVTGEGDKGIHYSGNWYDGSRDEIEKARKAAHGDFVWFERDGKSYVIDDPGALAGLKPMQDQMEALGKQQEDLGQQQEKLGEQQEALGKKMEEARIPTPDVSKEMSDLNAAIAKLNAKKGGTVSQEDLADLQGKIAELEGKLGGLEGEIGQQQGEVGRQQGELGRQQGELGRQQGQLGRQQGRIAREMDGKILTIIDESLKNGKARPVQ